MKIFLYSLVFVLQIGLLSAQEKEALTFEAAFNGDLVHNFHGGFKEGTEGLGLVNLLFSFDTEKAGWWKGGVFHINTHAIVGDHPSEDLTGDVQIASNIEGASNKFIYESWYQQKLGDFTVLGGLHNMNSEFFVSSYGGLYINSSFGTGPILSLNNAMSIYPYTTLGAVMRFDKEKYSLLVGVYNHGTNFVEEPHFTFKNHLFKQGYIGLAELHFRPFGEGSEYKLGATFRKCTDTALIRNSVFLKETGSSFYFLADQQLFKINKQAYGVFVLAGYNEFKYNPAPLFLAGGFCISGIFTGKDEEELGLGFTSARIQNLDLDASEYRYLGTETAIELTYKLPIHEKINIHPDLQYIINPSGSNTLKNALLGMVRIEVGF